MSTPTWRGEAAPPHMPMRAADWGRVVLRGVPLFVVVFGGLLLHFSLRLVEGPFFGASRPLTPGVTVRVCRLALRLLRIRPEVQGRPLEGPGAVVANHSSWLDVFVLNATKRIYFVSKVEVARWPGIGWLARATGTVFITRDRSKAAEQAALFRTRLALGHRLLFFPEGTSSDGQRVLPFKTTLFAAFFDQKLRDTLSIQPVSVSYHAPEGQDMRFYGWWGDMDFGSHLLRVLAAHGPGRVTLVYHAPLPVADYPDRKSLAAACEALVRAGFQT
jgi:1-acyl-sn-glycerol-3-phosphate acyltransferase